MKRILILIAAVLLPVFAAAQAQINTKKVKIGDFTQKVTKVVLTGNMFYDSSLEDEIVARWRVSPYEFCTLPEFEQLKGSDEYYFLLTTKGQFKKESEPGLQFLTLVKGGKKAQGGIDDMLEDGVLDKMGYASMKPFLVTCTALDAQRTICRRRTSPSYGILHSAFCFS